MIRLLGRLSVPVLVLSCSILVLGLILPVGLRAEQGAPTDRSDDQDSSPQPKYPPLRIAQPGDAIPLANPGFEDDGTGTASPAGWSSFGAQSAAFVESGGHSGGF